MAVDKTSDGILEELRQQANKEYRIFGYLNDVIWKNKLFYNWIKSDRVSRCVARLILSGKKLMIRVKNPTDIINGRN